MCSAARSARSPEPRGDPPLRGCSWLIPGRVFPHLETHDLLNMIFVFYDEKALGFFSFSKYEVPVLPMHFLSTKPALPAESRCPRPCRPKAVLAGMGPAGHPRPGSEPQRPPLPVPPTLTTDYQEAVDSTHRCCSGNEEGLPWPIISFQPPGVLSARGVNRMNN